MNARPYKSIKTTISVNKNINHPINSYTFCKIIDAICCCCLPTPLTLDSGDSDILPGGPPASLSVTPAGYVHTSRGDNVVRMWVQLKR